MKERKREGKKEALMTLGDAHGKEEKERGKMQNWSRERMKERKKKKEKI